MIPEEVFKRRRRHNNTPESTLLIIANFIVIALGSTVFISKGHVNWFFWVVIACLAVYNFFTIRRNSEEFQNKIILISYISSLAILVGLFFFFKGQSS